MVFLGYSFFGDPSTVLPPATSINNIDYIEIQNGFYDELYISGLTEENTLEEVNNADIEKDWDFDTVMHATFNGNTDAGNLGWNLDTTTNILVKKRAVGDMNWITIHDQEVNVLEDFNFSGIDFITKSNTEYQYAIVSTLGNIEGNYNISEVKSEFNSLFLIEQDNVYGTPITKDFVNTTRQLPSTVLSLPNNEYGVYCSNSIANYDTGSASGTFVYLDKETCTYDFEHIAQNTNKIMKMLTNRKPKILKVYDGRMWLIAVTGNPTDTGEEHILNRVINFEWAEIGNYNSEKDLYYAGLSDVPAKWWNVKNGTSNK